MTLGALSGGKASLVARTPTQLPAISKAALLPLLSHAVLSELIPAPSARYEVTRPGLIITLLALPSIFREGNNPSLCFSHRLSWLGPNLLASAGSVNVTVVEMANPKATGIYGFVSQGMPFYTSWKDSSTIDDKTIKRVRGDGNCRAPLECFATISSKQSPPLQSPQCLCPLEDDLVGNLTGKFLLPPFFPFPFS